MPDLKSLLSDDNYLKANEATKRAIFDKYSKDDQYFSKANPATQNAIRKKYGVATASENASDVFSGDVETGYLPSVPTQPLTPVQRVYRESRPFVSQALEAGGAIVGGLLTKSPAGVGLGYGLAKTGMEALDQPLGGYAPKYGSYTDAMLGGATDVGVGATMEVLPSAVTRGVGKAVRSVANRLPGQRNQLWAKQILQDAIAGGGVHPDELTAALKIASKNRSTSSPLTAQATAHLDSPTFQTLMQRMEDRVPGVSRAVKEAQRQKSLKNLSTIAPETATEGLYLQEFGKEELNSLTGPTREAAIAGANRGRQVADLERQALGLKDEATSAVDEVRNLEQLIRHAESNARTQLVKNSAPRPFEPLGTRLVRNSEGMTVPAAAELAEKASVKSAAKGADSIAAGEIAYSAEKVAQQLRAEGHKPLKVNDLVSQLNAMIDPQAHPEFGGAIESRKLVQKVADEFAKYADENGIIDARAALAIRTNIINDFLGTVSGDPTNAKKMSEMVMVKVKPMIDEAISASGGPEVKKYLADYTKGMHQLNARELTGTAAKLWKENPDAFVRLVNGESPEVVKAIFGPKNWDIAKELSKADMGVLKDEAAKITTNNMMAEQGRQGSTAFDMLWKSHMKDFQVPGMLSREVYFTNKLLTFLQSGNKTAVANLLTEASSDPALAAKLIEYVPDSEYPKLVQWGLAPFRTMANPASHFSNVGSSANRGVSGYGSAMLDQMKLDKQDPRR